MEMTREQLGQFIKETLDRYGKSRQQGLENDILLLEHNILFLQRKAIQFNKVSKGCLPRYRMLFRRYKLLAEKAGMDINEEAETMREDAHGFG